MQLIGQVMAWCGSRLAALLGRGASVKTGDFEIEAATTDGVVQIMREIQRAQKTRRVRSKPMMRRPSRTLSRIVPRSG